MSMILQSIFGRWRAMRRRHRTERDLRDALFELNDHLLRDVGLRRPRSACAPLISPGHSSRGEADGRRQAIIHWEEPARFARDVAEFASSLA
jgi:uncharacterized protein YjiS (DUF1127 family)